MAKSPRHASAVNRLINRAIHMRSEMLTAYRPDSCIAATRALGMALSYCGVVSRPISVRALVVNPHVVRRIKQSNRLDISPIDLYTWSFEPGGYCIGVGYHDPDGFTAEGKWVGHVALYLPDDELFVDLTLDQASRPAHGIVARPLVTNVAPDILGGRAFSAEVGASMVFYQPLPHDESYQSAPDWWDVQQTTGLAVAFEKHLCAR